MLFLHGAAPVLCVCAESERGICDACLSQLSAASVMPAGRSCQVSEFWSEAADIAFAVKGIDIVTYIYGSVEVFAAEPVLID